MKKLTGLALLVIIISLAACKSETSRVLRSDATIASFSLQKNDSFPGLAEAVYKVEQLSDTGRIRLTDSIRFGTPIDSVVPKVTFTTTVAGAVYYIAGDMVTHTGNDTLNFEQSPVYLRVYSEDRKNEKWYRIETFVHKVDPDLFVVQRLTKQICPATPAEQMAFCQNDTFYFVTDDGFVRQQYYSLDGVQWTAVGSVPTNQKPALDNTLVANEDELPISGYAWASFPSASNREHDLYVGGYNEKGKMLATRWSVERYMQGGEKRHRVVNLSDESFFAALADAAMVHYGDKLYLFGGVDENMNIVDSVRCSVDEGMNWTGVDTTHMNLPKELRTRYRMSAFVHDNNIYLVGGQSRTEVFTDVYRIRLNSIDWEK
ncbi:MAG: DUF6242 domain-containing protein [Paludibacteraceae bacterium]|nr:DUF6242 domain-containing protein [Paludibacteraceae bacterium]